jgi:hypothetical protein
VTVARLETLRDRAHAALERYREMDARNAGNDADFFPLLTLRHGIERTWSTIRWTEDALARLRQRAAAPELVRSGP